jgi:hypothetical protein
MTTTLLNKAAPSVDVPRLVRLSVFEVARCCHEAAYALDDDPCKWEDVGRHEQDEAMKHLEYRIANPKAALDEWHRANNPQGCEWSEVCQWRRALAALYVAFGKIMAPNCESTQQSDQCSSHA